MIFNIITYVSYLLVMLSFLFVYISDISTNTVYYSKIGILLINAFILLVYFLTKRENFKEHKKINKIFFLFIVIFFILPIATVNPIIANKTLSWVFEDLVFLLNIYLISIYIYKKHNLKKFIGLSYLSISIFLVFFYVTHFDNFNGVKNIIYIFNNELRYRNSFGLIQPNTVGGLCFISLVLSFYYKMLETKRIKKGLLSIMNLIILSILVSTSSRAAITSTILFYFIYYILKLSMKINKRINNKNIKLVIASFVISILLLSLMYLVNFINIANYFNINNLIADSNRGVNFTIFIPSLFYYNKEIFGFGYVSTGYIVDNTLFGLGYIDNWFLYILYTLGIIGLLLSFALIFYIFSYLIKIKNIIDKLFIITLFITFLYYSLFENIFFMYDLLASFIFWILIFNQILKGDLNNE